MRSKKDISSEAITEVASQTSKGGLKKKRKQKERGCG
jgi:hypothetical protein